ncbi:MAG: hypothetical protein VYA46_08480 [Verrucomicrobiota bacterium]|nr:hypothetical protein [Deltaproteobacteria bacterium]MEE2624251.1 hypothetical protein [Verrucomicrobiota bacterium]
MKLLNSLLLISLLLLCSPANAGEFKVAGITFAGPKEFVSVKPASFMRKAQLRVGVDAAEGEIVFFYFGPRGGGGVQANVDRWFGQFTEPKAAIKAKTEKAKAGKIPVTFVSAEGTFKAGPPRGPVIEKPGYALLGAIIEGKEGAVFAKFTGPKATVSAHATAFKTMITGAK